MVVGNCIILLLLPIPANLFWWNEAQDQTVVTDFYGGDCLLGDSITFSETCAGCECCGCTYSDGDIIRSYHDDNYRIHLRMPQDNRGTWWRCQDSCINEPGCVYWEWRPHMLVCHLMSANKEPTKERNSMPEIAWCGDIRREACLESILYVSLGDTVTLPCTPPEPNYVTGFITVEHHNCIWRPPGKHSLNGPKIYDQRDCAKQITVNRDSLGTWICKIQSQSTEYAQDLTYRQHDVTLRLGDSRKSRVRMFAGQPDGIEDHSYTFWHGK